MSEYLPGTGIFYTEWTLIQELLIGTAVKLRLIDELFRAAGKTISYPISSVGQLTSIPGGDKVDLSFREACNKIIHAKDFVAQSKVSKIIDDYEDKDYFEKEYLKKCKMFLGKKIGKKSKKRDILLALFRQFAVYEKAEEEDPSAQDMFKALDELIFCCKKDIKDAYDR